MLRHQEYFWSFLKEQIGRRRCRITFVRDFTENRFNWLLSIGDEKVSDPHGLPEIMRCERQEVRSEAIRSAFAGLSAQAPQACSSSVTIHGVLNTIRNMANELRDVAPGLWFWRVDYPDWHPGLVWERTVTSTCVESGGEVVLLDPLAPADDATDVWARLDARPPTVIVILKPDHVRDVDLFARRYKVRAFGPNVFHRGDVPETQLEAVEPGTKLPGGLIALYDGRGRNETPLWLPEQRALVFADALTAPEGQLRVWSTPWHNELVLPALRALLELPFEWVIVSHGEPVHNRAAYERALDLPPWDG